MLWFDGCRNYYKIFTDHISVVTAGHKPLDLELMKVSIEIQCQSPSLPWGDLGRGYYDLMLGGIFYMLLGIEPQSVDQPV